MPPPDEFPRADLVDKMATAAVQVAFGYRDSAVDYDFRRLQMLDPLPEHFREHSEHAAIDLRNNRAGRPYDPEWVLTEDQFSYSELGTPPPGGNFFPRLQNFTNLRWFGQGRRVGPKLYVVIAQLDDDSIAYFGCRITGRNVLERGRMIRAIFNGEVFDEVDDTIITFRDKFDWIAWKDTLIILNAANFHAIFRDLPALTAKVDRNLATITASFPIANIDEFADRIKGNAAMVVKLAGIIDRGNMHTRPLAELRQYASDYNINVSWTNDGQAVFDGDVAKQWNLLRLLDEGNTLGPVTRTKYETSGKSAI
jgi:hypothetical protein